jgi:hypothetical protein
MGLCADITIPGFGGIATGGSAMQAIDVLLSHGVQEEKILFLNLVSDRLWPDYTLTTMGLMMEGCRGLDLITRRIEEHL